MAQHLGFPFSATRLIIVHGTRKSILLGHYRGEELERYTHLLNCFKPTIAQLADHHWVVLIHVPDSGIVNYRADLVPVLQEAAVLLNALQQVPQLAN
jgi:hypothetical protein